MKIEQTSVTIDELTDGYADDGEGGVTGFGKELDIRPPYQREFIYMDKQRDDVIRSVIKGYPLNIMYWATKPDKRFEVLDGQQRTISICQYVSGDFSLDGRYFDNQPDDVQKRIKDYELTIYVCDGETSEKHDWFRIVNISGERLLAQELRNVVYTGPWLADAKRHFSRTGCPAKQISGDYVSGIPKRQELLETALRWISPESIEDYMGLNQHSDDAGELWSHFRKVIKWAKDTFPKKRPLLREVNWGEVYDIHKDDDLDPEALEAKISELLALNVPGGGKVIPKPAGVYRYVLDGDEQHLYLRAFGKSEKNAAYELQKGKCAMCGEPFKITAMHGDHIKPWKEGGLTTADNCQMLCGPCNQKKGAR